MDVCDQVVLAPALAALSDLSNGPGAAQPQYDGIEIEYVDDPSDCEPLSQDTDGPSICGGGASRGDGVDESTTAGGGTSGADTSGGSDCGD